MVEAESVRVMMIAQMLAAEQAFLLWSELVVRSSLLRLVTASSVTSPTWPPPPPPPSCLLRDLSKFSPGLRERLPTPVLPSGGQKLPRSGRRGEQGERRGGEREGGDWTKGGKEGDREGGEP